MVKLYTAQTPNGRKISIALEELGVPYEVEFVKLGEKEQMHESFLAMNPNHKIPVLVDEEQTIWESGAILLHLGERHDPEGRILPKDPAQRMEAIQYAFFQTGGVLDRILARGNRDYLVGPYTIGDIMHYPWLRIAQQIGAEFVTKRPRVVDWLDRIAAREAVERGMAVPA
jgi:GST-like protein